MASKYSGSEWVQKHYDYEKTDQKRTMSELGKTVADILGQVYVGIYHIDQDILRADLSRKNYVEMTIRSSMARLSTFDSDCLTVLVVLCHEAAIRFEVETAGPRYFRFYFHQRGRSGGICERVPTIDEHVKIIKDCYLLPELEVKS